MSQKDRGDLFGPERTVLVEPNLRSFDPRKAYKSDPHVYVLNHYDNLFFSNFEKPQEEPVVMVGVPILKDVPILEALDAVGEPYISTQYQLWSVIQKQLRAEANILVEAHRCSNISICRALGSKEMMACAAMLHTGKMKLYSSPVRPVATEDGGEKPVVIWIHRGDVLLYPRKL